MYKNLIIVSKPTSLVDLSISLLLGSESGDASSSEDEELQGGQVVPQKRQLDDNSHNPVNTRNVDYSWLIDCFKAH